MPARSISTATISFGLVSVPINIYSSAESKASVSFNMLHKKCSGRLKQQYICPKDGGEVVERSETVKGYEFAKDQYVVLSPEELKEVPKCPGSLDEALSALERDHEFLLRGDVFTRDIIQTWIDYKRERELDAVRLRPVPYEFFLYYDA